MSAHSSLADNENETIGYERGRRAGRLEELRWVLAELTPAPYAKEWIDKRIAAIEKEQEQSR